MTLDKEGISDPTIILISSILVSLPFPTLKFVLEHATFRERLGKDRVVEMAQSVIEEREQRRQRAFCNKGGMASSSALEERLWHNTLWVEIIETSQQHQPGFKLSRQRLGAETPTMSPQP